MLQKIRLFYQIRKFYEIFGTVVGQNFITKLSDMTKDNVHDVLFDLNEVLVDNSYCGCDMDTWLNRLKKQIYNFVEKGR